MSYLCHLCVFRSLKLTFVCGDAFACGEKYSSAAFSSARRSPVFRRSFVGGSWRVLLGSVLEQVPCGLFVCLHTTEWTLDVSSPSGM